MKRTNSILVSALIMLFIGYGAYAQKGSIMATASEKGDLSTFVSAVKAAGLEDKLSGEGTYTVFAPTNAAFDALPPGKLEELLKPENKEKLQAVLLFHVLQGELNSADIPENMKAKSAEGSDLSITSDDTSVKVNGANVLAADIVASNGLIHLVDKVILPPTLN